MKTIKNKKSNKSYKTAMVLFSVIIILFSSFMIVHTTGCDSLMRFIVDNFNSPIGPINPAFKTDSGGNFYFVKDNAKYFKILQLTDTHYGGGIFSYNNDKKTLIAIYKMIQSEKPDMVILTGDILYPMVFQTGTLNNMKTAQQFAVFMEKMQVPWTIILGNHDNDSLSLAKRDEIANFFSAENYRYCMFSTNPKNTEIAGYGNHLITIKNSDNTLNTALIMLDSHSNLKGSLTKYDSIKENQIDWYKSEIKKLSTAENGIAENEVAQSLLFVHIPFNEYQTAWDEYKNGSPEVQYLYGVCDQPIYAPTIDKNHPQSSIFNEILKLNSTQAVFCGHCHKNNFALIYKGIQLSFSNSIVYNGLGGIAKTDAYRGGTRILLDNNGFKNSQLVYLRDVA